jgi:hypothetical protein
MTTHPEGSRFVSGTLPNASRWLVLKPCPDTRSGFVSQITQWILTKFVPNLSVDYRATITLILNETCHCERDVKYWAKIYFIQFKQFVFTLCVGYVTKCKEILTCIRIILSAVSLVSCIMSLFIVVSLLLINFVKSGFTNQILEFLSSPLYTRGPGLEFLQKERLLKFSLFSSLPPRKTG